MVCAGWLSPAGTMFIRTSPTSRARSSRSSTVTLSARTSRIIARGSCSILVDLEAGDPLNRGDVLDQAAFDIDVLERAEAPERPEIAHARPLHQELLQLGHLG